MCECGLSSGKLRELRDTFISFVAIYHFTVKVVSRGKGQSAVAKVAYNSRARLRDERTGGSFDYRRKGGLVFDGIFAPKDAPAWVKEREALYNAVEAAETRKDAQLLREVEIGLPYELTPEQRERLVKDFVREQFVRRGMIADVAIHSPDRQGDERNHHAHILLTMRAIASDGFGAKVREWNGKGQLEEWRAAWERTANRYLERHGHAARIDRRSLEAQGIDREPTAHRGPQVEAMERDGVTTERGAEGRRAKDRNVEIAGLRAELSRLQNQIRAAELDAYLASGKRDRALWDDVLHKAAIAKARAEPDREPKAHAAWREQSKAAPERGWPAVAIPPGALKAGERLAGAALDLGVAGFAKGLAGAATAFESLFDAVPATPQPRSPPAAKEPARQIDLRRYMEDEDYRRASMQREIEERRQREREYYERQKERER